MSDDIQRPPCPVCRHVRVRELETFGAVHYDCQVCGHEWVVEK